MMLCCACSRPEMAHSGEPLSSASEVQRTWGADAALIEHRRREAIFCARSPSSRKDDPRQRLYFDVVAIARTEKGWELRSGLCKR
jgi:hypothetical protein